MKYGCHGQILKLELTESRAELLSLHESVQMQYLGGVGLGAWVLQNQTKACFDPLGPEAALVVALSPLVGTPLTTSAKFAIVAKSPLTGRICDAMCSSHFALAAKKLGADAICIKGRREKLDVLFIDGTEAEPPRFFYEPAHDLAGLSAAETERRIQEKMGRDWQILAIGRAGEQQISYATISHDGRHAGRGGLGAVMGSKNLKAIAVRGGRRVGIADVNQTMAIARMLSEKSFTPVTAKYRELGTVANLLVFNRLGALPTRNFESGSFENAGSLVPEELGPGRKIAKNSCASCTIGCEHIYDLKSAKPEHAGVRMEYESLFALGPLLGISDPSVVLQAASMCDEYGLDTISTGGTIAFLMQCQGCGLLPDEIVSSWPDFQFGHGPSLTRLIHEIVSDQPSLLAQWARLGSRQAAGRIGGGSLQFAAQVKGMEMPGYHPGRLHAMALGMAVGCRGADHNRSGAYEVDFREAITDVAKIAAAVIETENKAAVMDSMILCKFIRGVFSDFYEESAAMLQAVTGLHYTSDTLKESARAIVNLRKTFNQREGWTPAEDTLPEMFLCEDGPDDENIEKNVMSASKLQRMIRSYYLQRGWSAEGWLS